MGQAQLLPEPVTIKSTSKYENQFLKVGVSSMQGWRPNMEDAHTVLLSLENDKNASFFGVYDGHGGSIVSELAAANLHNKITNNEFYKEGKIVEAIENGYLELDEDISKDESLRKITCGSTALCTIIKDNTIYCGNVGDSRAIASVGGRVVNLSTDHKPFVETEIKRVIAAGGRIQSNRVNGRLTLSRALGDFPFKKNKLLKANEQIIIAYPDVIIQKLSEDHEFLLMACDGVWDVYTSEKALEFVRTRIAQLIPPENICEELIMDCLAPRNPVDDLGCDNMTVILICFLKSGSYEKLASRCGKITKLNNEKVKSSLWNFFERITNKSK